MKLVSARFNNFRLLKDLEFCFSVDAEKKLTVIRAANETGKTTTLNALMWCFFGEEALPDYSRQKRKSPYVLYPADLINSNNNRIEISVEIEFVVENQSSKSNEASFATYRVRRVVDEHYLEGGRSDRKNEILTMFRIEPNGAQKVSGGEASAIIESALPFALKDVYFTDGDSAMSFIEARSSERVSSAIESLLGLKALDQTVKDVEQVRKTFSSAVSGTVTTGDIAKIEDRLEWYRGEYEENYQTLKDIAPQIQEMQSKAGRVQLEIDEILRMGNKQELIKHRDDAKKLYDRKKEAVKYAASQLGTFLSGEETSKLLLENSLRKGLEELSQRAEKKEFPKANIPVLEELLSRKNCFCGAAIDAGNPAAEEGRNHILSAIAGSQEQDRVQEVATSVYYKVRSIKLESLSDAWANGYSDLFGQYQNLNSELVTLEKSIDAVKEKIEQVKDDGLEEKRELLRQYNKSIVDLNSDGSVAVSKIEDAKDRISELESELEVALRKVGKSDGMAQRASVAKAIKAVFEKVILRLKNEELTKVSDEMNRIFTDMIGADATRNDFVQIKSAELTSDFQIVVKGANGHLLNPDKDLNGASRRAITLAFILALTKVSQVEAPNVIDTPLGMMAGYVKQMCLLQTLKEGSQIVLFLTHDEIKGVEGIVDKYAGTVFTLTNPAHYPKMLANKPDSKDARILKCDCGIHESCGICQRKEVEVSNV